MCFIPFGTESVNSIDWLLSLWEITLWDLIQVGKCPLTHEDHTLIHLYKFLVHFLILTVFTGLILCNKSAILLYLKCYLLVLNNCCYVILQTFFLYVRLVTLFFCIISSFCFSVFLKLSIVSLLRTVYPCLN